MIPRYARPEAAEIWSAQSRFKIMFEIEAYAADAMAELGVIPRAAAERIWGARARCGLGRRADRRDRARDQARRHRLPDPCLRDRRARSALPAPGHDLVGRQRHGAGGTADPRHRPFDGRHRASAEGAEAPGAGAQADADRRPQPRHPRRADHLRPEAGRPLRRVRAQPRAAGDGTLRDRHLRHFGPSRHLRQRRSAGRGACRSQAGPGGRASLDPGDPA